MTTATAEWYRSLSEWGLFPQDHVPYDHHRWRLDLQLADLSDVEQLLRVSLEAPRTSRSTWPVYQRVGEQLWHEGWAGLIAPSAAHPGSLGSRVADPRDFGRLGDGDDRLGRELADDPARASVRSGVSELR